MAPHFINEVKNFIQKGHRVARTTHPAGSALPVCSACQAINFDRVGDLDASDPKICFPNNNKSLVADLGARLLAPPSNNCPVCGILYYHRNIARESEADDTGNPIFQEAATIGRAALARTLQFDDDNNPYVPESQSFELRAASFLTYENPNSFTSLSKWSQAKFRKLDRIHLLVTEPSLRADMFITNSQPYLTLKSKSGKKLPTVDVNILSQEIDFSAVKTWLSICDGSHGHFCSRGEAQASGLMVVNCTSLRVEPAPIDCRYIALSYVWGDDSPGSITNPLLWPNLPRTVRDAIQVCREINVQYLWVDRYCIDQENDETKLIQIEQMDRIYNTAHCVIIATAGKDANAGLPGVNGNSRLPQMTADVGDYYLISSVDHPRTSIKQSAWNSRGWTFQEGVLARRKLFFTESQMFFECNLMQQQEAISLPAKLLDFRKVDVVNYFRCNRFFSQLALNSKQDADVFDTNSMMSAYRDLVEMYSTRKLRFAQDGLRAFQGIISYFQRHCTSLFHIWGVPFLLINDLPQSEPLRRNGSISKDLKTMSLARGSRILDPTTRSLVEALLWYHGRFYNDLDMSDMMPAKRRSGFPSWSWTGWEEGVSMSSWRDDQEALAAAVYLEYQDGTKNRKEQFPDCFSNRRVPTHLPDALILACYVLRRESFFPQPRTLPTLWPGALDDFDVWIGPHIAIESHYMSEPRSSLAADLHSGALTLLLLRAQYNPKVYLFGELEEDSLLTWFLVVNYCSGVRAGILIAKSKHTSLDHFMEEVCGDIQEVRLV